MRKNRPDSDSKKEQQGLTNAIWSNDATELDDDQDPISSYAAPALDEVSNKQPKKGSSKQSAKYGRIEPDAHTSTPSLKRRSKLTHEQQEELLKSVLPSSRVPDHEHQKTRKRRGDHSLTHRTEHSTHKGHAGHTSPIQSEPKVEAKAEPIEQSTAAIAPAVPAVAAVAAVAAAPPASPAPLAEQLPTVQNPLPSSAEPQHAPVHKDAVKREQPVEEKVEDFKAEPDIKKGKPLTNTDSTSKHKSLHKAAGRHVKPIDEPTVPVTPVVKRKEDVSETTTDSSEEDVSESAPIQHPDIPITHRPGPELFMTTPRRVTDADFYPEEPKTNLIQKIDVKKIKETKAAKFVWANKIAFAVAITLFVGAAFFLFKPTPEPPKKLPVPQEQNTSKEKEVIVEPSENEVTVTLPKDGDGNDVQYDQDGNVITSGELNKNFTE